ncbi:MAG: 2-oxoglutarate ferredoxin oxidoreductase subunit alpha [Chloroflexi bacterium]|nr:MAG: 2-oxoglutarate ferredoxin oxidoreductase subunit alpha [Chloroflexota bacterium]MBA4374687.1 2-oxoacid:acceptor oxidoreductase subunit alpha [Anaerolinea sp.]
MSEKNFIENDFCITFSTVNGSGSATANTTIMRALFKMGIPVSGKNIFPSNIQGLPTWFSLRLSKDGYLARVEKDDIVVSMNPATLSKEIEYITNGGVLLVPDDYAVHDIRPDIIVYPMPIKKLIKDAEVAPGLRDYISNMVYVGILSQLLGIDLDLVYKALDFHFKGKLKAIDQNFNVVKSAFEWAQHNIEKRDPYTVKKMNGTDGCIMSDGNAAAALGSIYGGVQFSAWYPITPATSLAESLIEYLPEFRIDPDTGKDTYAVVQSEDELAAIGMAIGAGWGGLRSMTSTSGPGLSLMSEYIGLAYYAEVPVVIWDVQRVGPSTGMPTRTAQGDLTMVNFISHGDKNMIILIPGSINECFEFGWRAFDIAERLQTPVIVLSDLDFGMNQWMTKKFIYPDQPMDRGKVLWEVDLEKMLKKHSGEWGRYRDIDGDGIPYRTLPGNMHPKSGYFTRGTSHTEDAGYTEDPVIWETLFARIAKKFETAKKYLPNAIADYKQNAEIGIISSGSADPAVVEARDLLAKQGVKTNYLRIRSIPFNDEVGDFIFKHKRLVVIELNRDGQLHQLLTLSFPDAAAKMKKSAHMDGLPLTARWVEKQILENEENS